MTMMNDEQAGVADNKTVEPVNREEKKRELFRNQKRTLDLFLERGAISRAQYDKSLGDLILKMGIHTEE